MTRSWAVALLILVWPSACAAEGPPTSRDAEPRVVLAAAAAPAGGTLIVFGDSYSQTTSTRHTYPKWSKQLVAKGYFDNLVDRARGGTTASDVGRPGRSDDNFAMAVDQLRELHPEWGPRDVTVVYLGHLDILAYRTPEYATLDQSKRDYQRELDRLIALGATGEQRRIVLVLSHDRGINRSDRPLVRERTEDWNRFVARLAAERPGVVTADVFAAVDDLLASPGAYGIANTTAFDEARSDTTWLFFDRSHFGRRGQELIASVIAKTLTGPAT